MVGAVLMARKKIETPPEKIAAGSLPVMQERPILTPRAWNPLEVAAAINNMPSELDRADSWSNAPTRAHHTASLDRDDDAA
jgi:hypothetical protein